MSISTGSAQSDVLATLLRQARHRDLADLLNQASALLNNASIRLHAFSACASL